MKKSEVVSFTYRINAVLLLLTIASVTHPSASGLPVLPPCLPACPVPLESIPHTYSFSGMSTNCCLSVLIVGSGTWSGLSAEEPATGRVTFTQKLPSGADDGSFTCEITTSQLRTLFNQWFEPVFGLLLVGSVGSITGSLVGFTFGTGSVCSVGISEDNTPTTGTIIYATDPTNGGLLNLYEFWFSLDSPHISFVGTSIVLVR